MATGPVDRPHLPKVAFRGHQSANAAQRLLNALGGNQCDAEQIIAIDEATRGGHLEFRVWYRDRWGIPVPPQNGDSLNGLRHSFLVDVRHDSGWEAIGIN